MTTQFFDTSSSLSTMVSERKTFVPKSTAQYRTAHYHDGEAVRIQECRRRSSRPPAVKQSSAAGLPEHSNLVQGSLSTRLSLLTMSDGQLELDCTQTMSPVDGVHHVTSMSTAQTMRSKTVIVQSPRPLKTTEKAFPVFFHKQSMPTPPPTPKFDRLPTPELPELDEVAFCNCCVDQRVIKYCSSCGCNLSSS